MIRYELAPSLQRSINQFLQELAETLDISESHYEQAEERYQGIGKWLSREASGVSNFDPEIYPQGSFRLGTVTKPHVDADEYDIDLVCNVRLSKKQISQKELKELVGLEIKSYAEAKNMNAPAEEGRRCWTLNYAESTRFHMDILPAIPDGETFITLLRMKSIENEWAESLAITDNTLSNYEEIDIDWPRSNPKGYAEWFRARMEIQFVTRLKSLAESLKANVEDVPEYQVKTPLQRVVQLLKRHRDIMFKNDQDDKPISIIITTLAAQAYENEGELFEALINIVNNMSNFIQMKDGVEWVPNPVDPLENFADKWQEHPQRKKNFFNWMQQIREQVKQLSACDSIQECQSLLYGIFGEKVVSRVLKEMGIESVPAAQSKKTLLPGHFLMSRIKPSQSGLCVSMAKLLCEGL